MLSAISRASSYAAGSRSSAAMDAANQAPLECLGRREHPAGVAPLSCGADADQPWKEPRRAGFGDDPASREHEPESSVVGREPHVHRQGHRDADADGRAVDRSDDGLLAVEDPQRHHAATVARHTDRRLDVRAALGERLAATTEVGPGAERAITRTGDDHGPHVVVGVDLVERVDDLSHHHIRERVHPLGPVQRDRRHRVGHVVDDLGVLHASQTMSPARTSDAGSDLGLTPGVQRPRRARGATPLRAADAAQMSRNRDAAMPEPIAPASAPIASMISITVWS